MSPAYVTAASEPSPGSRVNILGEQGWLSESELADGPGAGWTRVRAGAAGQRPGRSESALHQRERGPASLCSSRQREAQESAPAIRRGLSTVSTQPLAERTLRGTPAPSSLACVTSALELSKLRAGLRRGASAEDDRVRMNPAHNTGTLLGAPAPRETFAVEGRQSIEIGCSDEERRSGAQRRRQQPHRHPVTRKRP